MIFRRSKRKTHTPGRYLTACLDHLDTQLREGLADTGPEPTAMWLSSLDARTAKPVVDRPADAPRRVYRNIDAPGGSAAYWDMPLMVAARRLGDLTERPALTEAAHAYLRDVLARSRARNGLLLWGNHYFWDASRGCVVSFRSEEPPEPVDVRREDGALHEARPLPPAWDLLAEVDAEAADKAIGAMGAWHVFDPRCGGFNRHADRHSGCAFLESGGILVESLCWQAGRTRDGKLARRLVELAMKIAGFSWAHRRKDIDLPENNPTRDRWDKLVCTTEVGLWAGSLLRAFARTGQREFLAVAYKAMAAYLEHGYDDRAGLYFGRLNVADGSPDLIDPATPYMPGEYADNYNAMFPTHDYPLAMAEACAQLLAITGDDIFREGVERFAATLADLPNPSRPIYAESLGRAVWFLLSAAETTKSDPPRRQAEALAEWALEHLWTGTLFRTHTTEDRYDAVDGLGLLMLALIRLETGQAPDAMGFGF